jgi:carbamoyl-phosphate synthase large subunit
MKLPATGVLEKYGVELIGAKRARSRWPRIASCSRGRWRRIGLGCREGRIAHTWDEAHRAQRCRRVSRIVPTVVHVRRELGGGIAYNREEFETIVRRGLAESRPARCSSSGACSVEGVRARGDARHADNVVIVCSIENLDPMGVHTGDSITVRRR